MKKKHSPGYNIRAEQICKIAAEYYEPGRQDRSYKWVWRYHILPIYGINYRTFLKYMKETGRMKKYTE